MPAVASGKLRNWIEIQYRQESQDSTTGEVTITWAALASVWAEVVPMSAREFRDAQAQQSEVRGRMVIRYRSDVDATMRVLSRGKVYNILGAMPDDESGREHLTLLTGEGVNLGA